MVTRARFAVGQLIRHRQEGYRGVVANVDPQFRSSPQWYRMMIGGGLAKELPRYYVLVDGEEYATYVAESQLEDDESGGPVRHPHLHRFFDAYRHGHYIYSKRVN